ncbi:glycosyltransferase family 4 protein [Acinetobacter cumulans]|uniref:glycosyltransferase family 4 protein n=1 Tax=Acinetobacter cumulans TaxID=2136182 RepID=UPI001D19722E|nr:glycosyltransferase family 4 protein [Acinetobacter cumulans]
MERLNWHIADELSHNHNVILLSHSKAKNHAPKKCEFKGVSLNPLPIFLLLCFIKTLWICLTNKPDIIFAGSGLTAPIATFWAKIFRIKSMVYIHGLDIANKNMIYNKIWVPMIKKSNKVIANSTPTYDICLKKGIDKNKLSIIHPGVHFPPEPMDKQLIQQLKSKYNLLDKKILISVGRLTERKGLNEFVDLSLPTIIQQHPDSILVIIGDTPNHSLNKKLQSKELILTTAKKHKIDKNILFVGNISDDKILSSWYYLANSHIFPVKHMPDDPEGFGMVAIEAAAHGTPTVAFATGGIVEAVHEGISGYLVENYQYNLLCEKIISCLDNNLNTQAIQLFSEQFSWKNLNHKINNEMNKLCQKI